MPISPDLIYLESACGCSLVATITDLRSRRIPNWLTGLSFALGVLLHLLLGGPSEMGMALLGGLLAGAFFFVFFVAGGMGAGDVKLIAAVGTLCGTHNLMNVLIAIVILGAAAALAIAFARQQLTETLYNVRSLIEHHQLYGFSTHPELNVQNSTKLRLPYALPIAGGCFFSLILACHGGTH